jgi:transposase-like protein
MSKQLRYSKEFQERAVRRMKLGDNVSQLSRELGVHRTCLYRWKRQLGLRPQGRKRAVDADWRDRRIETLEAKIARLERIIGGQWQELDFFESALRRIEKKDATTGGGESASTPKSVPGCNRKAD